MIRLPRVVGAALVVSLWAVIEASAQVPHWVGEVTKEFGVDSGGDAVIFADVTGLHLMADGELLVVDPLPGALWSFPIVGAPDLVAGEGRGPGELAGMAWGVRVHPTDDELWLTASPPGFQVYSKSSGGWTAERQVPFRRPVTGETAMFANGRVYVAVTGPQMMAVANDTLPWHAHVSVEPPGDTVLFPTLLLPDSVEDLYPIAVFSGREGRRRETRINVQLLPRRVLARAPDASVAQALTHIGKIMRWDARGQPRSPIVLDLPRPAVSADDRARELARLEGLKRRLMRSPGAVFPEIEFPLHKPVIRDLWFDQMNRLWVELHTDDDPLHFARVYGIDGSLLFTAQWPGDVSLRLGAVRDNRAAGVRRGAYDMKTVAILEFRSRPTEKQ